MSTLPRSRSRSFVRLATVVVSDAGGARWPGGPGDYRYRVTRLLEMANMRTRIATDLHDDIGANLTRIAMLPRWPNKRATPPWFAQVGHRIHRQDCTRVRELDERHRLGHQARNPARLDPLAAARREEVLRSVTSNSIRCAERGRWRKAQVDLRRDLLLIFKEAVNAARHSGCSRVDIDLHIEASRLWLSVADNGGFDASAEPEGQGLASMQRRGTAHGAGRHHGPRCRYQDHPQRSAMNDPIRVVIIEDGWKGQASRLINARLGSMRRQLSHHGRCAPAALRTTGRM